MFLCMIHIFFVGCKIPHKLSPYVERSLELLQYEEIIAKHSDLPDMPFQTQLHKISIDNDQIDQLQIFYVTSMFMQDSIRFYQQQMERIGWDILSQSQGQDCLLIYTKPDKICSVLLKDTSIAIYYSDKKGA